MKKEEKRKLVIIGAGAAGLSAAIYAARAGMRPLVLENGTVGGQMSSTTTIENYPGFPSITGAELSTAMRRHAEAQGAQLEQFDPFVSAALCERIKVIETESCRYLAEAVIIAAGVKPVYLPPEIEQNYRSRGVHYCALCDGSAYRGKQVGVVGGGSSALEDALYLAAICEGVTLIRRKSLFHAEKRLMEAVNSEPKIRILYNTELVALGGGEFLEYAEVECGGIQEKIPLSGLFCRLGSEPASAPFSGTSKTERGYIITDSAMRTNLPFVYAAGDIREKEYRQILTAASDGAAAAISAERDLGRHRTTSG